VENCQVGVFLAYAVPGGGRALIDRELYLAQAWADDRDRCRQAGIDDELEFATKPELARQMIERAITARMPFGWVAADEVYGQNTPLRDWLDDHDVSYMLAVPRSFTAVTAAGKIRADELAALVPAAGWQQIRSQYERDSRTVNKLGHAARSADHLARPVRRRLRRY
jgi:SRSO17 transposase